MSMKDVPDLELQVIFGFGRHSVASNLPAER
jgi:hypothetical protein